MTCSERYYQKKIIITITEEMVRDYAIVSGDRNPIHLSKEAANKAGYSEKLVHGMLTMALSAKLLSHLHGKYKRIRSFKMNFLYPLYVNDKVVFTGTTIMQDNEKYRIQLCGKNQKNITVIKGKVTLN